MGEASARRLPVLAGTDPLPLPGGERVTGTYGVAITEGFDPGSPETVREVMLQRPDAIRIIGRRAGPLQVAGRLVALARTKGQRTHA